MLSQRLARSVWLSKQLNRLAADAPQLPRATSTFSRSAYPLRSPLGSSFVRYQSNGGEEKVKGQVIGIDLGESTWPP